MYKNYIFTLVMAAITSFANAQVKVNPNVVLPKDSVQTGKLIAALNDFLAAAQAPTKENKLIFEPEKIETLILTDEIAYIEKGGKNNTEDFYKPYLTNVVTLNDSNYLIQVAYIGINEATPFLRASFELIAHKANGAFLFSSPLVYNTKNWKIEKADNSFFHYQYNINKQKVNEFGKLTRMCDAKLGVKDKIVDYYCTDNVIELQKLVGVNYKADYNGTNTNVWGAVWGNRKLVVFGNHNAMFDDFDPHDAFHDRLALVMPRSKVNKPVDEGCAYLYGGSWGLTWKEIFKAFKEQVASNKATSWTEVKETPVYFVTKGYKNSADYIVNALLVKKIEKEKGFEGVWELMKVGPVEKGHEKYYQTLEKLTGITKANYDEKVWELINNEK